MSEKNGAAPDKPDVEALRAEIKQTRADLGETVQALAAKADVKARAKEQVEHAKQRVRAQAAEATGRVREVALQAGGGTEVPVAGRRVPVALLVAGAAAIVGVIFLIRGSRR